MKFYLIEISEGNTKIEGKGVYEYATLDAAVASFHSKMGSAMKSDLFKSEQLVVLNSENGIHKEEKWNNPNWVDPEPEPEPQPEPELASIED